MADICVIYKSEDKVVVERLVGLLRRNWDTWWSPDIAHGDWEEHLYSEVAKSRLVISVLSEHTEGSRGAILKDEMAYAKSQKRPLLPFLIGPTRVPLGFGRLDRIEAYGWVGDEQAAGFNQLLKKISVIIGSEGKVGVHRPIELLVGHKALRLPAFVFSLSSHETQVSPHDGADILNIFQPEAMLLSAYDAWKYYDRDKKFDATVKTIRESKSVLFLDSGNYESHRKGDIYSSSKNPDGWRQGLFRERASRIRPDIAFSFDKINPTGEIDQIVSKTVQGVRLDQKAIGELEFPICPIVHLPKEHLGIIGEYAARLVSAVASDLDPVMIAIPERELGEGIIAKTRTVRQIRDSLNTLGKYYPLHLLGTGNPLSMIALAVAGADSFDGLEWCRTVADYERGYLFHFQQFEFFSQSMAQKIQDPRVRRLVENPDIPYGVRVLSYNVDFFRDHTQTMQNLIHSGQTKTLLNMIPGVGPQILKELSK